MLRAKSPPNERMWKQVGTNQVVTILNTCFWVFLVLTVLFFAGTVVLFFLFDIKTVYNIETGRAKSKSVKQMLAANRNTGHLRTETKGQTSKLSREKIEKGRAPAVTPPTENTKKEFYQPNDDEAETELLAPQPNPEPAQPDSANSEPVFAETTVLSSHTDDIVKIQPAEEPAIGFRVVKEVLLVHTSELIPSL